MNLDGGDYHPLYAQRKTIGYNQMTEVVELANKNFAAIFSDPNAAHGAGTLGIFNRSLGPDQTSPDKADYTVDPGALDWPSSKFYLHSLHIPDAQATGHVGAGNSGAYRSPAPLPNGNILVSYAANAMDLASFQGNFDLFIMDGSREPRLRSPATPRPTSCIRWRCTNVSTVGSSSRAATKRTPTPACTERGESGAPSQRGRCHGDKRQYSGGAPVSKHADWAR